MRDLFTNKVIDLEGHPPNLQELRKTMERWSPLANPGRPDVRLLPAPDPGSPYVDLVVTGRRRP